MKYRKKILSIIVLMGLAVGLYFVYLFGKTFFWDNTIFEKSKVYVYINEGDDFTKVTSALTPLLKSISDFSIAAQKKGYSSRVKSGKFVLLRGSNNNEIINALRGKSLTVRVTFNNQERLEDLAGRVAQQIAPDSITLLKAFLDSEFLAAKGFSKENALGMYLPNTYDFFWNTTAENFRDNMWKSYQKFWSEDRKSKATALGLTPKEVMSLAAIVQKESQKADERPRVAGVYLNRLKRKMKLQADPTVIYAMKLQLQNFDMVIKRVLYKDLEIKSPYNTYQYRGVPPGPITMPDMSSIKAVLNAEQHSYLYFVANPNNPGYHLFAKNGREHNRNKKIYTNWLDRNRVYR
ncbi:MAG: endolytic transglycosylase MltG [Bacteroidetes bacterium]|nr:endolytic transglycosylase MltG [Bacteroidota bacterium]